MDVLPPTNGITKPTHSALGRHVCHFAGCTKSFLRKEHLTRHEKSHTADRSFVCHICKRGFNRKLVILIFSPHGNFTTVRFVRLALAETG